MGKRYTTESFAKAVHSNTEGKYTVIGMYSAGGEKILTRCNICGNEWSPVSSALVTGRANCPTCTKERLRKEQEKIFLQRMASQVGDEYSIVSDFKTMDKYVTMRHNICGHEWKVKPEKFTNANRTRCPKCCERAPVPREEYEKRLEAAHPGEYSIVEYNGAAVESRFKRLACGHTFKINSTAFLSRKSGFCPVCAAKITLSNKRKKRAKAKAVLLSKKEALEHKCVSESLEYEWLSSDFNKIKVICKNCHSVRIIDSPTQKKLKCQCKIRHPETEESLQKKISAFVKDEYSVLGRYSSSTTPMTFQHLICGCVFSKTPSSVLNLLKKKHEPCPMCGNKKSIAKTSEQFQHELDTKYGKGSFSLLSEYRSLDQPIKVRHKCGHEYEVKPEFLIRGQVYNWCPNCRRVSSGESLIADYLKQHNVDYKTEYTLPHCKYKGLLRFDFAIFKDKRLKLLIEYDGEQHYESVDFFGGERTLQLTQLRDKRKNEYCFSHGLPLLRIPYTEKDNIPQILESKL